jgi:hypothetical protein
MSEPEFKVRALGIDFEAMGGGSRYDPAALGLALVDENLNVRRLKCIPLYVPGESRIEKRCWDEFWNGRPKDYDEEKTPPNLVNLMRHFADTSGESLATVLKRGWQVYLAFRTECEAECAADGVKLVVACDNPAYDVPKLQQLSEAGGEGADVNTAATTGGRSRINASNDYRRGLADMLRLMAHPQGPLVGSDSEVIASIFEVPDGPTYEGKPLAHNHMPQNDAANHDFAYLVGLRVAAGLHKRKRED